MTKQLLFLLVFLNFSQGLFAQPVEVLENRRQTIIKQLGKSELALVISYPVRQLSLDINYEYHSNPNIRYLTGLTEPGVILLLLSKELAEQSALPEALVFVRPIDPQDAIWHGARLGSRASADTSGAQAYFLAELPAFLAKIEAKQLSLVNAKALADADAETKRVRKHLEEWIVTNNVQVNERLLDMLKNMREVKDAYEIDKMRKVIDISCIGHEELLRASKNELAEYQMEAVIESVFRWHGAQKPAYPSIIGGGANSCVLHYTANAQMLTENQFVVADVGAEFDGYAADITRSFPVGGRFSEEQKTIYNIVLEAQKAGIEACMPGKSFRAPDAAARNSIAQALLDIGIISKLSEARNYFMHGTSHYLGLDVHDLGTYGPLKPGSIITVEPGVYIPAGSPCDPKWWNIGVRIEDDVLITESGYEVLSDCVVKSIPELEKLMTEESIFDNWKKQGK